ncbi:MAG TPA: Dabb family protein [Opitutaceae bacterium]|nr:Dabb family protein [Opitutaceae bacterium]
MKKIIASLLIAGVVALSAGIARAQMATAPKTVIHVVTVTWKAGTLPAQIQAALDGAQKLPAAYPGITHVWTKTLKAQGERTHVIAMEFASEQALKEYTDSAAQKEWYKVYLPIRDRSTTFDVTN